MSTSKVVTTYKAIYKTIYKNNFVLVFSMSSAVPFTWDLVSTAYLSKFRYVLDKQKVITYRLMFAISVQYLDKLQKSQNAECCLFFGIFYVVYIPCMAVIPTVETEDLGVCHKIAYLHCCCHCILHVGIACFERFHTPKF